MSLGTLVVELTANVAKFQSDLGRAEQIAQNTAKKIDAQFAIVKSALATFGVGLASFVSIDALVEKIDGVIASAAGLQQLSERTGATVENLSALSAVAKLSGTDTEQLAGGLQKLSRAMLDAQQGGSKTSAAFTAVGISTKDLASQRPDEVFIRLATELAKFQDGAAKTAVAQELLGKSGANLLPVMKDLAEVGDLQVRVTADQSRRADEYEKNLVRLKISTDAIFKKIGLELVPVLNAFTKAILDSENANDGLRGTVDALAKDGSIRTWAENIAIGVGYVVDVITLIPDVVIMLGKTIGAAAAQFMALMDVAKGAGQILAGDFSKGVQTARAGIEQVKLIGHEWGQQIDEIWNRPLFSERLKKQLEAARQATESASRGALPNLGLGGDTELMKKQLDGQLKALEHEVQEEQHLWQLREQFLAHAYGEDLLSIADYYDSRRSVAEDHLRTTEALYDREVAALKAYQAQVTDAKAQLEVQTRIEDVQERSRQLTSDTQAKSALLTLEQAKATRVYNDEVERLNIRLLELRGNLSEAGRRQGELQDRQLRQRLTVEHNTQGLAVLDELERIQSARSAMSELNLKSSAIEEQLGVVETRVAAQREAGAMTELQSMAKLSVARREAAEQLAEVAKQMEAVAQSSGDPRMLINVEAFKAKIEQLAASSDVLGAKFRVIFEDNLGSFLTDLVSGAKSFKEAFLDMARGIEQAITRIVAQNLAQSLFGASGMFGGGGGGVIGWFTSLFSGAPAPPARAGGGDVYPNQAYLVGERGPEMFVPNSAGAIVPNDQLGGSAGRGSATPGVVIHNHFAPSTDARTIDQAANLIGQRVQRAMRRSF